MKLSILEALNISVTGFIVVLIILALLACIIVVLSKLVRTVEKVANKKSGKDLKQSDAVKNETVSDAAPAAPTEGNMFTEAIGKAKKPAAKKTTKKTTK